MSAHKHTPGPWHSTGRYVGSGHAKMNICECSDNSGCWSNAPEAVANARLIAAAPELLEACMAMLEWDDREKDHAVDFYAGMDLCRAAFDKARAAIAKATGEPA